MLTVIKLPFAGHCVVRERWRVLMNWNEPRLRDTHKQCVSESHCLRSLARPQEKKRLLTRIDESSC